MLETRLVVPRCSTIMLLTSCLHAASSRQFYLQPMTFTMQRCVLSAPSTGAAQAHTCYHATCALLSVNAWTSAHMQLNSYIPATHIHSRVAAGPDRVTASKCHCVVKYVRRPDSYAVPATICSHPLRHAFLGDDPSLQTDVLSYLFWTTLFWQLIGMLAT